MENPLEPEEQDNGKEAVEQQEEFPLTDFLSSVNHKLFDGIIGVCRRAWNVLVRGWEWIFSRRMFHCIVQGILLVVLAVVFFLVLCWPFLIPAMRHGSLFIVSLVWFLFVGVVGVWQGFKNGTKMRNRLKAWWARRKRPAANAGNPAGDGPEKTQQLPGGGMAGAEEPGKPPIVD